MTKNIYIIIFSDNKNEATNIMKENGGFVTVQDEDIPLYNGRRTRIMKFLGF